MGALSQDKSLIEASLREYLSLKKIDLIIYKNGFIFIKITKEAKRREISQKDRGTIAERYNGISEEELAEFYEEFFLDGEHKDFFLNVSREFVHTYFHLNKITNIEYEKNVFGYIQKIIFQELVKLYENRDDFFTGFAGYLFRHNFKHVFEHIAGLLLEEIMLSNSAVIEFLNYYSNKVIVIGGKKYEVPEIKTDDGNVLRVVSILPIVNVYFKAKIALRDVQKEILKIRPELKKLYIGTKSPVVFNADIEKSINNVEIKIVSKVKKLKTHYENLDKISSKTVLAQKKQEKKILLREIKELNEEVEKLSSRIIQSSILKNYTVLKAKLDALVRHQKNEQKILSQLDNKYTSIRDALVKALVSKKKVIS